MRIPPADHTLGTAEGYYLNFNIPNKDVLISYTIPPDLSANHTLPVTYEPREMCLKFWYYFGATDTIPQSVNDYFNVSTTRVTNITGKEGYTLRTYHMENQWLFQRVNFKLAINENVSIKAHTSSIDSVLAFDDILIQNQACEQPGWCDFENGKICLPSLLILEVIN